jgi:phosphoglycolate phosphatase
MSKPIIIFDLDGTLINSAPSILKSLKASLYALNIRPCKSLTPDLIGPPLTETVASILSIDDIIFLPKVLENFKNHYDGFGYKETLVYSGIEDMLNALNKTNHKLYIATNKRIIPARLIVKMLDWDGFFSETYSLDSFSPPYETKTAMLANLNSKLKKRGQNIIYVGDRRGDEEASSKSGMKFLWAKWGYGEEELLIPKNNILLEPSQLLEHANDF